MANILKVGEKLQKGEFLSSQNGLYKALMQTDGNFCVYKNTGELMWGAGAVKHAIKIHALMQTDGNFCTYTDERTFLWGTQATSTGGSFFAIMQNDGNFCVYKGAGVFDNRGLLWQAKCGGGVVMQPTSEATLPAGNANGDIMYWNGTGWVAVAAGINGSTFRIVEGVPTWVAPMVNPRG